MSLRDGGFKVGFRALRLPMAERLDAVLHSLREHLLTTLASLIATGFALDLDIKRELCKTKKPSSATSDQSVQSEL